MFVKILSRVGIIAFLSSVLVVFLLYLMFVSLRLFGKLERNSQTDISESYDYQYLEMDIDQNSSTFGVVSMSQELGDEYLTYQEKDGNHVLISKLGSREYKCTGTCYCEEKRRVTGSMSQVGRPIAFLVAGLSFYLAVKDAEDWVEGRCKEFEEELCNFGKIGGSVDECDPVHPANVPKWTPDDEAPPIPNDPVKDVYEEDFSEITDYGDIKSFLCRGRCLTKELYKPGIPGVVEADIKLQEMADEFDCNRLQLHFVVQVEEDDMVMFPLEKALRKFMSDHLDAFCRENSRNPDIIFFKLKPEDDFDTRIYYSGPWCWAFGGSKSKHGKCNNPTVFCRNLSDG